MKTYPLKVIGVILIAIMILPCIGMAMIKYPVKTAEKKIPDMEKYAESVENFQIPEDAVIVGIGEATHGNVEFQMLKLTVLQKLVKEGKCRSIAFEMPAGSGAILNSCVHEEGSSVENAVKSLSYALYRTKEMTALVEWIQEYNMSVDAAGQINIYGIDMQCATEGGKYVADYVRNNFVEFFSEEEVSRIQEVADWDLLSDVTLADTDRELFQHIQTVLKENASAHEKDYLFDQVLFNTKIVLETFDAPSFDENPDEYSDYRDRCMAKNVQLVEKMEKNRGFSQVVLTGHNGHVMRGEAVSYGNIPLGQRLTEKYAEKYFVIGTEFFHADVNIHTTGTYGEDYERKNHYFCSADPIAAQAKDMENGMFYLDFSKVTDTNSKLYELLHKEIDMGTVGEGYTDWIMLSMSYRTRLVQAERFDAVIYVYRATPIEPYEN